MSRTHCFCRFSIYPTNLLKVGSNEPSDFFLNFISALKKSSHFTENVNEACFLIPHFDHTLVHSQALHPFRVGALLRQLPHWNEGRNHLLLNKNDFPTVEFNFGYAMVAKVGWSDRYYRPLFDISLPPPLPCYPVIERPALLVARLICSDLESFWLCSGTTLPS